MTIDLRARDDAPHWPFYKHVTGTVTDGLGILNRSNMFAAVDNTMILPSYARFDAAVYYSLTERSRLQNCG